MHEVSSLLIKASEYLLNFLVPTLIDSICFERVTAAACEAFNGLNGMLYFMNEDSSEISIAHSCIKENNITHSRALRVISAHILLDD